jgi:hypothetical protein
MGGVICDSLKDFTMKTVLLVVKDKLLVEGEGGK